MHLLTLDRDGPTLGKGRWAMEDTNAATYLLTNQAVRPTMEWIGRFARAGNSSHRILVLGTLGFGDALLLTPVLREIKARNPDWPIHVACMFPQRQVFSGLPYIDGFEDYPIRIETVESFDPVLILENAVEFNEAAKTEHMTDRFLSHLGFNDIANPWVGNKKPDLILSGDELSWAKSSFPRRAGKRRLGIQVSAGARNRTYPMSKFSPEMDKMVKAGWEIALMGSPGDFRGDKLNPGIIDMSRHGLTWRQTVAFMTTCDCILAPDSSLMHAAGALDIPCVALFGPFPYQIRTKYYDTVFALHGSGKCPMAPCFHSHHFGLPIFPKGGPCNESGICDELASIEPERIRAKIEQLSPVTRV
jgi:ADP-heptose:LPS heptosyltransferase